MSQLWDVCEECGSTKLTFVNNGEKLTVVYCDECDNHWEDEYPGMWDRTADE